MDEEKLKQMLVEVETLISYLIDETEGLGVNHPDWVSTSLEVIQDFVYEG